VTFVIDTGAEQRELTAVDYIPDWMRDICDANSDPVKAYAHHIIGSIHNPKKLETARAHLLANWQFLRLLGTENPGLWDEIWGSYWERING
jgi:hypothetical protein